MDAHFGEQRRGKAEAGVHFLLVTYSLGKQRKVTRWKSEKKHHKKTTTAWAYMPPTTINLKNNLLLQSHHTSMPTNAGIRFNLMNKNSRPTHPHKKNPDIAIRVYCVIKRKT
jgi:hypothetical protein